MLRMISAEIVKVLSILGPILNAEPMADGYKVMVVQN